MIDIQLEAVLQTRARTLQKRTMNEYLIKCMGYLEDDATWEREETLLKDFSKLWRDEGISISLSGGGCEIPKSHRCKNNVLKFIFRIESLFPSAVIFIF